MACLAAAYFPYFPGNIAHCASFGRGPNPIFPTRSKSGRRDCGPENQAAEILHFKLGLHASHSRSPISLIEVFRLRKPRTATKSRV